MKQPATTRVDPVPVPPVIASLNGAIDTETLELLEAWAQRRRDQRSGEVESRPEGTRRVQAIDESEPIRLWGANPLSVSPFIFLDSGPFGLLTHPRQTPEVVAIMEWLSRMLGRGSRVLVPALVDYELKRELLRAQKPFSVGRLDAFAQVSNRYLALTDEALCLAAELWAKARQQGRPTADSRELDIDVILAAQVLSFGAQANEVVIATTNAKHLAQFTNAKNWDEMG